MSNELPQWLKSALAKLRGDEEGKCPACGGSGIEGVYGFGTDISDFRNEAFRRCHTCHGTGIDVSTLTDAQREDLAKEDWGYQIRKTMGLEKGH